MTGQARYSRREACTSRFMPRERRDMTGGNEIDWRRVRILLEVSRVRSKGF
jgi:hypothetical protein